MTSVDERLYQQIRAFDRTAWRWECQGEYAVDAPEVQRWRDGHPTDMDRKTPWLEYIRDITSRGMTFQRARMLTDPLTEYLRWMIEQTTHLNVEAGEDIRWVRQADAAAAGMPSYDFYLFDDARVAIMRFDDAKLLTGLELVDDPDAVAQHRAYRDMVWPRAIRHADYRTLRGP